MKNPKIQKTKPTRAQNQTRAALALQRKARMEADIRAGRPLRDGKVLFETLQAWMLRRCSIDEGLGLDASARRLAARDHLAMAVIEMAGRAPDGDGNGCLGSARADICLERIDAYVASERWREDRHRKIRPDGPDGACWVCLIDNRGRAPSIDKLRKIYTKGVEEALVKLSLGFTSETT